LGAQLDPYVLGPLGLDSVSMAALQARALLDSGRFTERDFAAVAARHPKKDPNALLKEPYLLSPLRAHDLPPVTDCAAAVVLAVGDLARKVSKKPAWIRGIDQRLEAHSLGARDLAQSPSTVLAAKNAGVGKGKVDVAEIHAP